MVFILAAVAACGTDQENDYLTTFKAYFEMATNKSDQKWEFLSDTVKVWFDDKEGTPNLRIKGAKPSGLWYEWDQVMRSSSYFDTIWYDRDQHAVKGYFYENNDFYELIGKPATKTLRSYFLNDDNKIEEILIYWIPEENTLSSEYLVPIVAWAMNYDSVLINKLYPEGRIVPSGENAQKWKELLTEYRNEHPLR